MLGMTLAYYYNMEMREPKVSTQRPARNQFFLFVLTRRLHYFYWLILQCAAYVINAAFAPYRHLKYLGNSSRLARPVLASAVEGRGTKAPFFISLCALRLMLFERASKCESKREREREDLFCLASSPHHFAYGPDSHTRKKNMADHGWTAALFIIN
jgi:hypothetical protein